MKNIIISNSKKFNEVKELIKKDGIESLHVLSDFDRTLTKAFVGGKEVPSLISILRDHNYLTPDYPEKAHALFNKYHPIEIDPNIPRAEKAKAMRDWWKSHYELLIDSKLNKTDIANAIKSGHVEFRKEVLEFFDLLKKHHIPMVIISSAGLGAEAIKMFIEKHGRLYENIHVVSNEFEWDNEGYMLKVKEPVIHVMNKNETTLKDFPFFNEIKDRKNILLLGDSLDDLGMAEGADYKNIISVGFLNKKSEEHLENYKNAFDCVITNDSDMNFVNNLIKEIV